jgi:hypothetical protein
MSDLSPSFSSPIATVAVVIGAEEEASGTESKGWVNTMSSFSSSSVILASLASSLVVVVVEVVVVTLLLVLVLEFLWDKEVLASLGNEDSEITLVVRVGNVGVLPPINQIFPILITIYAQNL